MTSTTLLGELTGSSDGSSTAMVPHAGTASLSPSDPPKGPLWTTGPVAPLAPLEKGKGRESLLAFFGSEEIGQALHQGAWTLQEELGIAMEIARSPGMKASDKLRAMAYLRKLMEVALRMDGLIVEERNSGHMRVTDAAGHEALLTKTQSSLRLLGEGRAAMDAAMSTTIPGEEKARSTQEIIDVVAIEKGTENDPQRDR